MICEVGWLRVTDQPSWARINTYSATTQDIRDALAQNLTVAEMAIKFNLTPSAIKARIKRISEMSNLAEKYKVDQTTATRWEETGRIGYCPKKHNYEELGRLFAEGRTNREVSEKTGITRQYVAVLRNRLAKRKQGV